MSETAEKAKDLPEDTDALKAIIGVQKLEIERLQEQLRLALHKRFGASSEKTPADQLGLFNEAEVASTAPDDGSDSETEVTVPEHKRRLQKGGRKKLPDHLPRLRVEHDIPDADKLWSSSPQDSHLQALTDTYVTLSCHTAPIVQPWLQAYQ